MKTYFFARFAFVQFCSIMYHHMVAQPLLDTKGFCTSLTMIWPVSRVNPSMISAKSKEISQTLGTKQQHDFKYLLTSSISSVETFDHKIHIDVDSPGVAVFYVGSIQNVVQTQHHIHQQYKRTF